jgi:hypothetical protein
MDSITHGPPLEKIDQALSAWVYGSMVIETKIANYPFPAQIHSFPLFVAGCWILFSIPKNIFQGQAVDRVTG